jgi:peptidyl-tRNA hydrolase, PTH1 family
MVLDYFAYLNSLTFKTAKADYYLAEGDIGGNQYQLIKPSTYVNNSGLALRQVLDNNEIDKSRILVIYDDVNLPFSELKVNPRGGDGGHNGISSIIYHLNSDEFARIRIGVGSEFEKGRMAEYVLTDFSSEEMNLLEAPFNVSKDLIKEFITDGLNGLLNANSRTSNESKNNNSENNNFIL